MLKTYKAILDGDRLQWSEEAPLAKRRVEVHVTVIDPISEETEVERKERGKRMADALRRLSASGAFKEITDPVAWQREIRKDKPLYGREED